ncbi:penicillin-binding transpeptidase domain-containing protein [Sporolactobacillus sp. Y61]|uniref:Penicillin-binding transpeptidase domain-containing protein n=1 Tax=Sporolactobacillus sp. Y61 TaxID=3160863 RepID=A0AAU8IHQ3_9BACL
MFRRYTVLAVLLFSSLLLLSGCGGNQPTAQDRFKSFTKAWQKQDFSTMYQFLSSKSQKSVSKSAFVDRYERIYSGIEAGKLNVTIRKSDDKEKKSVPFTATLETVAGPVRFSQKASMTQESRNDKENWYLNWTPSLILPGMTGDDKVRVHTSPAKRGEIADRNGRPLAMNGNAARIDIVPGQLPTGADREKTLNQLSKLLGVPREQIDSALKQSWVKADSLVPVRTVNASDLDLIKKATQLPGIYKTNTASRIYPDKQASAHLTGYVGKITAELLKAHPNEGYSENSYIGRTGLELLFEKQLRQQDGAEIVLTDAAGNEKATIASKEAKDGQNIQLTIDKDVQDSLYSQLQKESGTATAINPKTGDILGLVSAPSYDPNDFVLGISPDAYNKLQKDPKKPLLNRFTAASAPGSTFKPFTAAVALSHQAIDPNQSVAISGSRWQKDKSWGDYYVTRLDHDPNVNLREALFRSDNIYFAQTALKIGAKNFAADSKKYGFGESLPIPYAFRKSTLSGDGKLASETLLANSGYGQGEVSVNPLHMSLIYSAFVNNGSLIKPRLLMSDEAPQMWKKNVMSPDTAKLIHNDLIQVIDNPAGTARDAKINGLPLAGKTGTPEFKQKQGENGRENGWFVAYNTDDPKLLITMIVENTQDRGGSHAVTPKVKAVFQKYFNK